MLNENVKKWVAALRLGKYRRTTGMLHRRGSGYCCLGVACEVYIQHGGVLTKAIGEGAVTYDGERGILPVAVKNWLGLRDAYSSYNDGSLASQNDSWGMTFARIADLIESEPDGLFV